MWAKPPAEGSDKPTIFARRYAPETGPEVERLQQLDLIPIPCGKCYGCRSDQRLMWTIRCTHEASQHEQKTFLTLTIDDDHMPWHGSLDKTQLSGFLKRLRHECTRVHNPKYRNSRPNELVKEQTKIRFFAAGEYGDTSTRAHYHALLFGLWPQDASKYGADTYTSSALSALWTYGSHQFSEVTPERIAYICGYVVKKMGSMRDNEPYGVVDPETGEYVERTPAFSIMSRRPGIGATWFTKYERDLKRGHLMHEGNKVTIPRFYERKYQDSHPEEIEKRKQLRAKLRDQRNPVESTLQRLRVKEAIARAKETTFKPIEKL